MCYTYPETFTRDNVVTPVLVLFFRCNCRRVRRYRRSDWHSADDAHIRLLVSLRQLGFSVLCFRSVLYTKMSLL